ncbi:hypothetical protein ACVBEQ_03395 [Nakamurella sp. GG22]
MTEELTGAVKLEVAADGGVGSGVPRSSELDGDVSDAVLSVTGVLMLWKMTTSVSTTRTGMTMARQRRLLPPRPPVGGLRPDSRPRVPRPAGSNWP